MQSAVTPDATRVTPWRARAIAFLRIAFGAIWAIPEGFGGPYKPGDSTDVGTALLYALMFAVLLAVAAGRYYAVDRALTPRLGPLGFLAAGKGRRTAVTAGPDR